VVREHQQALLQQNNSNTITCIISITIPPSSPLPCPRSLSPSLSLFLKFSIFICFEASFPLQSPFFFNPFINYTIEIKFYCFGFPFSHIIIILYCIVLQMEPIPGGNLPPGFDSSSCRSV
jgi:hypothetical protein